MSSKPVTAVVTAVRAALVLAGVGIAVAVVLELLSRPPPPNSDGFAHGMAAIVGSILIAVSLGVATLGIAGPTLLGVGDPLGFGRWQRLGLKAAGVALGGGLAIAAGYGVLTDVLFGVLVWLPFVLVASLVTGVVVVWRVGEATIQRVSRTG